MTEPLYPLQFPLSGSRLIEASAGTGKTWTIASLVVRLVLGHDCTPRTPAEVLVMTFTKAATRELSDRIRRRLLEAAALFRGESRVVADEFLQQLLLCYPEGAERRQAAWRLSSAAESMDEAAVHTIDAWCQRMLREHAFDSGSRFDEELQADEAALRTQAVHDYWRQQVYSLNDAAWTAVGAVWPNANALAASMKDLHHRPLAPSKGQGTLQAVAEQVLQARAEAVRQLKIDWGLRVDRMRLWLEGLGADPKGYPFNKRVISEAKSRLWLERLDEWARADGPEAPNLGTGAVHLRPEGLQKANKTGTPLDIPGEFEALADLLDSLPTLPDVAKEIRQHAALHIEARVQALKAQRGTFGFADLLERLDQALDPESAGPAAERLRQRILQQYPVALIDEFQDTSPVQLRIFQKLYRLDDAHASTTLLLIGDPKQAIYGFRGADIYSYLRARRATAGRHYALDTNHRSTAALVSVVNRIFERAELRTGEGAFRFRRPGQESPLPFRPVQARGRSERWVVNGGMQPALTAAFSTVARKAEDSRAVFAALCAERIVGLLNEPGAGFEQPDGALVRLRPADIAVLVRSRSEADAVRAALHRRGLPSVYLSDKNSVWQSREAADLLRWLQAVAHPRDSHLVRAAMATDLLNRSMAELQGLAQDDTAIDGVTQHLEQLRIVWRTQGVLAMVRRTLHLFELPARCLAPGHTERSGERRLTNVLQLAELLQAASAPAPGEQALLRWMSQQIAAADGNLQHSEDAVVRLESDDDLVKVVTVHKSKGLEYPLVFLPFGAGVRELTRPGTRKQDTVVILPTATNAADGGEHGGTAGGAAGDMDAPVIPRVVIAPQPAELALARAEQEREDLRLLYVALTRARHALWVGLGDIEVKGETGGAWGRSAFAHLIGGADCGSTAERATAIDHWAAEVGGIALEPLPAVEADAPVSTVVPLTRLSEQATLPPLASAAAYTASFNRQWSISSYSALVRHAAWTPASAALESSPAPWPTTARHQDEPDEPFPASDRQGPSLPTAAPGTSPPSPEAPAPWHRFPRGASAGNFLHEQLEWLATERFALASSTELQESLHKRCERQGWGHRVDDVQQWLRRVCTVNLPSLGGALSELHRPVPELEFWFPSDGLTAAKLDAACAAALLPGRQRPALAEKTLQGMLMGFADLVLEHQGRYWVLDYKSNALGAADSDYTMDAMESAVLQHRYDVQAALYLLALHRLLRARLGKRYEPERQFGGAIYWFLRGVNGPSAGCCTLTPPTPWLMELDAQLASAADQGPATGSRTGVGQELSP